MKKIASILVLLTAVLSLNANTNASGMNFEKINFLATKEMAYVDGNGNKYLIVSAKKDATIEYIPIKKAESSSGEYSGGEPYKITITIAEHKELNDLLRKASKDDSQLIAERNMGCGTIILPKTRYFLKMDSFYKTSIEKKLKELKTKYFSDVKSSIGDTLYIKGIVVERSFESKKGVMTDIKELFFEPTVEEISKHNLAKQYFIKLSKGKVLKTELKVNIGKPFTYKLIVLRGLWDADDNTHQSRFGDYVIILENVK